jgi:hypothetical protein
MALRRRQDRVLLDWFNVSYQTLLLAGLAILVVSVLVTLYLMGYLGGGTHPRAEASRSITEATRLLEMALAASDSPDYDALRHTARGRLGEARQAMAEAMFPEALAAATESQQASRRLLALVQGKDSVRAVQFYRLEGKVQVKKARQLIWKDADKGMPLDVGDQIKTGSSASAQIIYFNGTVTTIKPGSILEIKELFDDPATRVQKVRETLRTGRMVSSTQNASAEGSVHEVTTQNASVQARGRSQFETRFDELNAGTEVGVYNGAAVVESGNQRRRLAGREQVSVNAQGKLGATVKLPPTPTLLEPIDQKIFTVGSDGGDAQIRLLWEDVELPGTYHLQLSSSSLFGQLLLDRENITSTRVLLPPTEPGSYYWRAAFRTPNGLESAFSETRKFKVLTGRVLNVDDTQPPELVIDDFLVFSSQVIVRGRTESGAILEANGKKVDVGDDGSFTTIVKLRKEGRNNVRFVAQDAAGNETTVIRVAEVKIL